MTITAIEDMQIGSFYAVYLCYPPIGDVYMETNTCDKDVKLIKYTGLLGNLQFLQDCIIAVYELDDDEICGNILLQNI